MCTVVISVSNMYKYKYCLHILNMLVCEMFLACNNINDQTDNDIVNRQLRGHSFFIKTYTTTTTTTPSPKL